MCTSSARPSSAVLVWLGTNTPSTVTSRSLMPSRLSCWGGVGQQRVLGGVADLAGGRQDEPAGTGLGVGGDLAQLIDVAELVGG